MIKKKKHSCCYDVHREIVHKLSRTQLFWLCILALTVLGAIGVFAPRILLGML